jgi:PD-(D/E)XK nuclease superfamily
VPSRPLLRLTNSETKAFRRCRRKWWLSYHRGLVPRTGDSPLAPRRVGTIVHDALAAYYEHGDDPIKTVTDGHQARLIEFGELRVKEVIRETALCEAMVAGYLDWLAETGADSEMEVIGAERAAEVPLGDGAPEGSTMLAKLDAVVDHKPTGQKLAFEFKTVTDLSAPLTLLRIDSQFRTEHLVRFLLQLRDGATAEEAVTDCSGILWRGLRRVKRTAAAKPPFYREEIVSHNIHELRNHWRHVVSTALEIDRAQAELDAGRDPHLVAPPTADKDCKWSCDFFSICPMFDDGSRVEEAISANFEVRDPLERYDGAAEF